VELNSSPTSISSTVSTTERVFSGSLSFSLAFLDFLSFLALLPCSLDFFFSFFARSSSISIASFFETFSIFLESFLDLTPHSSSFSDRVFVKSWVSRFFSLPIVVLIWVRIWNQRNQNRIVGISYFSSWVLFFFWYCIRSCQRTIPPLT